MVRVVRRRSRGIGTGGDIFEGYVTLDILASKDSLVIPRYKDSDVA